MPPWHKSVLVVKVEAVQGKQVPLEWTETFGNYWNGDTTLEFLSSFLLRASRLQMQWERWEIFHEEAVKGSLISSYEAEMGLLWMLAGPSFFLSSGDGYVGEFLELQ